jgi:hypothetical protein
MEATKLKKSLLQIAKKVQADTTVEDIFKQFSFLMDIEESEEQEKRGEIKTQKEVEKISKEWLK